MSKFYKVARCIVYAGGNNHFIEEEHVVNATIEEIIQRVGDERSTVEKDGFRTLVHLYCPEEMLDEVTSHYYEITDVDIVSVNSL